MKSLISKLKERLDSFLRAEKTGGEVIQKVPLSEDVIDLETAQNPDREDHVKFYDTENAQVARGAEKAPGHGLDKFKADDGQDPEELEAQIQRERNQTPDLSERFY